jgi:4-amino-4-deoxy-L-arabinose transferase-like glycosyltransferase
MPYHVLVSRQALLDGPAALWATLALFCLARFVRTERGIWVVAAASLLGLAVLSKESALILSGAMFLFLASRRWTALTRGALFLAAVVLGLLVLAYPFGYFVSGEGTSWTSYVTWQLLRRGEQPWYSYLVAIAPALGGPVLLGVLGAGPLLWRERGWREALLALWIVVPLAFFLLWPVKGFAHLVVIAPPMAILAARALMELPQLLRRPVSDQVLAGGVAVACLWLAVTGAWMLRAAPLGTLPAGAAGLVGGRNTAEWIDDNLPRGATLMSTDPAMADILQFYGHRRTLGLSVPAGLGVRNPAHTPIENPDLQIRQSEIQYIVWDTYAGARHPAEAERLLAYVQRYHGREIYRYEGERASADGRATFPITIVYEVRP